MNYSPPVEKNVFEKKFKIGTKTGILDYDILYYTSY